MDNGGGPGRREFEVLLIGENLCGKSALIKRFTGAADIVSTYGEKLSRTITLDDEKVKMVCWDLADVPRWITIHPREAYRSADGIVILYSCVDTESFDTAMEVYKEVQHVLGTNMSKVILVGTKCDLTKEKTVNFTVAKDFANRHDMLCFEVSAHDGTNVEYAFLALVTRVLSLKP